MSIDRKEIIRDTSNSFVVDMMYEISKKFSITIPDVIYVFDEMNYWNILNDDETCCLLAHDGVKATIKDLEEQLNAIISRNT